MFENPRAWITRGYREQQTFWGEQSPCLSKLLLWWKVSNPQISAWLAHQQWLVVFAGRFNSRDHPEFPSITAAVAAVRQWCQARPWPLVSRQSWLYLLRFRGLLHGCRTTNDSDLVPSTSTTISAHRPPIVWSFPQDYLFLNRRDLCPTSFLISKQGNVISECQRTSDIGRVPCLKKNLEAHSSVPATALVFPNRRASAPLKVDDIKVTSEVYGNDCPVSMKAYDFIFCSRQRIIVSPCTQLLAFLRFIKLNLLKLKTWTHPSCFIAFLSSMCGLALLYEIIN